MALTLAYKGEKFVYAGTSVPSLNTAIDSGDGRNYYKWVTSGSSDVKMMVLAGAYYLRKVRTDPPKPYVTSTDQDSRTISYYLNGIFHERDGSTYTQSLGQTYYSFSKTIYHWSNGTTTEDANWSTLNYGGDTINISVPSGWSGPSSYTFPGFYSTDPDGASDVTATVDLYEN